MYSRNAEPAASTSVRLQWTPVHLIDHLSNRYRSILPALTLLLVFILGFLDYATGPNFSFAIFYVIPIFLASWLMGKQFGILISLACGFMWLLVDLKNANLNSNYLVHYWNAAVRLGFFLIITYTLSELKNAHERITKSFVRISEFSANLAHELRTPINNLAGEAEVALSRDRDVREYREVLESSLEEYERISNMIDSLLFLARAENAETRVERKVFEVGESVKAVQEFYDAMAEEKQVSVTCEGNALLNADPVLFRRAMSNLLANAHQHSVPGGKICISVRQLEDQSVEVTVSDTGCGIASEHLPKIFDRFYRVDSLRSEHSGSGLGLAIVKSIMDLHQGNVNIQSQPEKGTTVILKFPS